MLILALDTSSKAGSIAVFDDSKLIQSCVIGDQSTQQRASAANFPIDIQRILGEVNRKIDDIEMIAVAVGPGSFTGLRVGVVAAKTLAYSLGSKIVGVNSLSAISASAIEEASVSSVCAVMDAQRGQLFAARFESNELWAPRMIGEVEIIDREHLIEFANGVPVAGPGLEKLSTELTEVNALDRRYWSCNAERIGRCGIALAQSSNFDDLWALKPRYYRASAAEEKRKSQTN